MNQMLRKPSKERAKAREDSHLGQRLRTNLSKVLAGFGYVLQTWQTWLEQVQRSCERETSRAGAGAQW